MWPSPSPSSFGAGCATQAMAASARNHQCVRTAGRQSRAGHARRRTNSARTIGGFCGSCGLIRPDDIRPARLCRLLPRGRSLLWRHRGLPGSPGAPLGRGRGDEGAIAVRAGDPTFGLGGHNSWPIVPSETAAADRPCGTSGDPRRPRHPGGCGATT